MGIHRMIHAKTVKKLEEINDEIVRTREALNEARELGDLSENAEYDAVKTSLTTLIEQKLKYEEALTERIYRVSSSNVIEPGCVIEVKQYGPYKKINSDQSNEEKRLCFEGRLLFGGAAPYNTFNKDFIFKESTPVGKFINGKPSGRYELEVPGGWVTIDIQKILEPCEESALYYVIK